MSTSAADFNSQVIAEFRANDGVVGGMFAGAQILLLHHTGAKSGQSYSASTAPIYGSRSGRWLGL